MKDKDKSKEQLLDEFVPRRRKPPDFEQSEASQQTPADALKESEALYHSLFDGIPVGLYRTTPEGRFLAVNSTMVNMLGYPDRANLLSVNAIDLYVNPDDRSHWQVLLEQKGIVRKFEVQFYRSDGTVIWVNNTARAVKCDQEKIRYYQGSLEDISDRKQTEEELQRYKENLEEIVAERTIELTRRNLELKEEITERQRIETELKKAHDYIENVFENSPDAIGIVDESGRFIMWNRLAAELYGYTFDELEGKSAFDLYADKEDLKKMLEVLRRQGFIRRYETNMKKKDGTIVPFEMSISLLKDTEGKNIGSVGVARDLTEFKKTLAALEKGNALLRQEITERQQIEIQLEQARDYLENVLENSPDVIGIVDKHGKFIMWNRMAVELYGYSFDGLEGKSAFDLYADQAELGKMLKKLRRDGSVKRYEINMIKKNKTVFPAEISIGLLKDALNNTVGSVSVVRDLSEAKKTLSNLSNAYEKLKCEIKEHQRAKAALRQSEEKSRTVLESNPDPIVVYDITGNVDYFNPAFRDVFG
ncbi:PAS domain S-box protein, partial [Thermodesulfobacteriota bacterium]